MVSDMRFSYYSSYTLYAQLHSFLLETKALLMLGLFVTLATQLLHDQSGAA
jgi:hypothetical protein